MTDNMVKFLMPDGTEVSNDPKFGLEEALQKMLDATPNKGDVGVSVEEQKAQTQVEREASMNSTQPGVGSNPVPDDIVKDAYGPLGSPAQQLQKDDAAKAAEDGANPSSTSVDDAAPVDSNAEVLKVREAQEAARAKYQKAVDALGDDGPGSYDEPYTDWTGKQLKAEVAKRNADGRDEESYIKLTSGMTKPDVATLLDADDAAGNRPAVTEADPAADTE